MLLVEQPLDRPGGRLLPFEEPLVKPGGLLLHLLEHRHALPGDPERFG